MSRDFEKVKAYLKQNNENGETLYDHLTNVLLKISKEKTEDPTAQLEALSVAVKKASLTPTLFREVPASPQQSQEDAKALASVKAALKLFGALPSITADDKSAVEAWLRAVAAAGEDEEEGAAAKADDLLPGVMKGPNTPNLMGHSNMLEWAGVSLGRDEMFKIMLSMRALTESRSDFLSVRFFGKIFGTQSDYFIVEAKMTPPTEKEAEDAVTKKEVNKEGANEFTYLVTNSLEGKWETLPDVLPEQIITARAMRRYMTGNIRAPVLGYPRFPWPEGCYLRAQIARIAAATVVSPKGLFTMEEPEEEGDPEIMKEDPEFEPVGPEELNNSEGWCHSRAHILKQGRCKRWEPPEEEEEEEAEPAEDEEEEEEEEPIPMLNGLDADEGSKAVPELWKYKTLGHQQHAVSAVVSVQWPGAVTVAKGKSFANIYVGWGSKFLGSLYGPPPLPVVATEYVSGFNPEEAEEDETDPMIEMTDPLPPKEIEDEGDDEGDEDEDDE